MTSPNAVLDMIRRGRPAGARLAVVTAAAAGPPLVVTVRFIEGGETFQPSVLTQATVPDVGDKGLIVPTISGWIYVGAVVDPAAPIEYEVVGAEIQSNWWKSTLDDDSWHFQLERTGVNENGVQQGRWASQTGSSTTPTNPTMSNHATILDHGATAALTDAASGGWAIDLVEIDITRTDFGANAQASPVMYGHLYDAGSPPTVEVAPSWEAGFGPVRLAPISRGQTGRYRLPTSWVTALQAGTITGLGFFSDARADALSGTVSALRITRSFSA